jgi:hypothetical protein
MYMMAMMGMLRIYQNRHSDIQANANTLFATFAVVIVIGMFGVLTNTAIIFRVIFAILHLIICMVLGAQEYFIGNWKLDFGTPNRVWAAYANTQPGSTFYSKIKPLHFKRMLFVVMGKQKCLKQIVQSINWKMSLQRQAVLFCFYFPMPQKIIFVYYY